MFHPRLIISRILAIAALLSCALVIHGQASPAPAAPNDPKELMLAAARLNNLTGSDILPWHIKASFRILDETGSTVNEGTYEESWAGPDRFKRTVSTSTLTQTEFRSEKGVLRAGSPDDLDPNLLLAAHELTEPLPAPSDFEIQSFTAKETQIGRSNFNCIHHDPGGPTYCFSLQQPILRISSIGLDQALRNRILGFQNRFVPGDLTLVHSGRTVLTLHIESIELLSPEANLAPPPDARIVPRVVNLSGKIAEGMLLYKVAPEYPLAAKRAHITGTVVLHAVIGDNGRLRNITPVSGPEALQGAAMQSVYQWRYRPYVLNGKPVEVETTITVLFAL